MSSNPTCSAPPVHTVGSRAAMKTARNGRSALSCGRAVAAHRRAIRLDQEKGRPATVQKPAYHSTLIPGTRTPTPGSIANAASLKSSFPIVSIVVESFAVRATYRPLSAAIKTSPPGRAIVFFTRPVSTGAKQPISAAKELVASAERNVSVIADTKPNHRHARKVFWASVRME